MRTLAMVVMACLPLAAAEKAAYDSNGRVIALITGGEDVAVSTNVIAVLPSGKRVPLQVRRQGTGARRQGDALAWSSAFTLPDGGRGQMEWKSEEDSASVRYAMTVKAESALEVGAIEFVVDLPRPMFLRGTVTPQGGAPVVLGSSKPADPVWFQGETSALEVREASGNMGVNLVFDKATPAMVFDRWDAAGRSFQVRAAMHRGTLAPGGTATLVTTLSVMGAPPAAAPARLVVDGSKAKFRFEGFGGNYCWNNESPASQYTLNNLKLAWARSEMKVQAWDRERGNPGPQLRADLETMKRFQQAGVPYVISVWWLPERFYTDPFEKTRSTHFRIIDPEKWGELLDTLGSYLQFAKQEYGVEPDLFSFNEANIGVYVGQTPESHLHAIKKIGAHFEKLGLKTKMLLGDATGPRDTHRFVLEAASDPEALKYVGAVGFHSWGGGTPEQYAAWGDVAEWLNLPLLVTELGVDAAAYYTRSWDSYHYGLREAQMTQELLMYARPQGTQFWQFTNDYGLVRATRDGSGGAEPTPRFFLMKHFTDLTPQKSEGLAVTSDQKSVLATAFRKGEGYVVHILNLGATREAVVAGLPAGEWSVVETTEETHFQTKAPVVAKTGELRLGLPGRGIVTLTSPGAGRAATE